MFKLFLLTSKRFLLLIVRSFSIAQPEGAMPRARPSVRRRLMMLAFLPLLGFLLAVHWLGFLLDELFFRGYRRTPICEPLFVLGVPRSGTTSLHRVLAQDPQFTTFSTWESLFALSVSARKFWLGLARLDRRLLGGALARALGWVERRGFGAMDEVHPMTLDAPEEDYFALLPILSCFILVVPFPFEQRLWDIGQFDRRLSAQEREAVLTYYRRCLQKHLYVHGPDKRLLSKNAAFAPLAQSLQQHFPDARFLICLREPERTLPSQLSSIAPGLAFFGTDTASPWIRDRFIDQLGFYYLNLSAAFAAAEPNRCAWLSLRDFREDLAGSLTAIYRQLGLPLAQSFVDVLAREAQRNRRYQSGHRYSLAQFGLDEAALSSAFASVYRDPQFAGLFRGSVSAERNPLAC